MTNDGIEALFKNLWNSVLDDDRGINTNAYESLVALGNRISPDFVSGAIRHVDATDGRFYIT